MLVKCNHCDTETAVCTLFPLHGLLIRWRLVTMATIKWAQVTLTTKAMRFVFSYHGDSIQPY